MSESGLCLFQRGNVIICTSCDSPPADSVYLKAAPEGVTTGEYSADDPRLVGQDGPLPETGGEV